MIQTGLQKDCFIWVPGTIHNDARKLKAEEPGGIRKYPFNSEMIGK